MNSPDLFYQNYSVLDGTVSGEAYTVMRKLIIIAHSLYKSEEMYDKERYRKTTGLADV